MPPVKMIACHYANKSGRGKPACFLTLAAVQDMVDAGQAQWNKRGTYVNFTKTEAEVHHAAPSLRMPEWVMDGVVEGKEHCLAILAGWRPYMVPSSCMSL